MKFSQKIFFSAFLTFVGFIFVTSASAQLRISDKIIEAEKYKKLQENQQSQTANKIQNININNIKVDSAYEKKMLLLRKKINEELEKTTDPKKEKDLILKLKEIDNSYYNPKFRTELIRKKYPGYAARIDAYSRLSEKQKQEQLIRAELENIKASPEIIGGIATRWDNLPDWEKQYHCKQSVKECFANELKKCRFVLDRCYEFTDKQTFKKVRMMFVPQR
ncbi:MAG: hypothetical protein SFT90_00020 [Rickettsiales bacterium]|nr:hypothetical protein [Rickettsiales bacterium]